MTEEQEPDFFDALNEITLTPEMEQDIFECVDKVFVNSMFNVSNDEHYINMMTKEISNMLAEKYEMKEPQVSVEWNGFDFYVVVEWNKDS